MFFIDTIYVHALVNTRDQWHPAAQNWERWLDRTRPRHVTTEYVLFEVADGLAAVQFRRQALLALAAVPTRVSKSYRRRHHYSKRR